MGLLNILGIIINSSIWGLLWGLYGDYNYDCNILIYIEDYMEIPFLTKQYNRKTEGF